METNCCSLTRQATKHDHPRELVQTFLLRSDPRSAGLSGIALHLSDEISCQRRTSESSPASSTHLHARRAPDTQSCAKVGLGTQRDVHGCARGARRPRSGGSVFSRVGSKTLVLTPKLQICQRGEHMDRRVHSSCKNMANSGENRDQWRSVLKCQSIRMKGEFSIHSSEL